MLTVVAILTSAGPLTPSFQECRNEYAVKAVITASTNSYVIFTDESDKQWTVSAKENPFSTDIEYVFIVHNNNTPADDTDDYIVSILVYNRN